MSSNIAPSITSVHSHNLNITTALFQHMKNKRKIAPEKLKEHISHRCSLCMKAEHANVGLRSSSPDERQAVSLLGTELALAWTSTSFLKNQIIDSSYQRNFSPPFRRLAPDLSG